MRNRDRLLRGPTNAAQISFRSPPPATPFSFLNPGASNVDLRDLVVKTMVARAVVAFLRVPPKSGRWTRDPLAWTMRRRQYAAEPCNRTDPSLLDGDGRRRPFDSEGRARSIVGTARSPDQLRRDSRRASTRFRSAPDDLGAFDAFTCGGRQGCWGLRTPGLPFPVAGLWIPSRRAMTHRDPGVTQSQGRRCQLPAPRSLPPQSHRWVRVSHASQLTPRGHGFSIGQPRGSVPSTITRYTPTSCTGRLNSVRAERLANSDVP
jgi:hypothetical protein